MAYSFTEKKRIRKDFGKRQSILEVPVPARIQLDSYRKFLQAEARRGAGATRRRACTLRSRACSRSRATRATRCSSTSSYRLGEPVFDVKECQLRGLTYAAPLRVKVRLVVHRQGNPGPDQEAVKDIREQEVYLGEMPLMTENGTFVVNGTERVIVSQLHRCPGVFFDHDRGKTHSSGKLLFSARIIPYRGSWLDFEFDPKDCVFARIDRRRKLPVTIMLRALGYTEEQMLDMFFDKNTYHLSKNKHRARARCPRACAARPRSFDDQGRRQGHRRGRPAHHRAPRAPARAEAGVTRLPVPKEYLIGKVLAHDVVNTETGEMLAKANEILTIAVGRQARSKRACQQIRALYVNDLDRGPYISDTLRIDPTTHAPGGAGRDLPHDASGRAADQGRGGEPVPEPVLQPRALRPVGRRPHEVQPPRAAATRSPAPGILYDHAHFAKRDDEFSKKLVEAARRELGHHRRACKDADATSATATARSTTSTTSATAACAAVGEMAENAFRIGLVRVERAVKERLTLAESPKA